VSTTAVPNRFTTLHGEDALQATVTALEEHGFSVEVVDDLDAAREAVLDPLQAGARAVDEANHQDPVMTHRMPRGKPRSVVKTCSR